MIKLFQTYKTVNLCAQNISNAAWHYFHLMLDTLHIYIKKTVIANLVYMLTSLCLPIHLLFPEARADKLISISILN